MSMDGARKPCQTTYRLAAKAADARQAAARCDRVEGATVFLLDIERPALAIALARRGLTVTRLAADAVAALIGNGGRWSACPAVIEAAWPGAAIALLDAGADDVVLRSDDDDLVAARLAALVRRSRPGLLQVGDIAIDTVERSVSRQGRPLPLLPREFALLHYLARHADTAVDHATLHQALWGRTFDPGTNVIAVHVSRLRAKLRATGVAVVTDRGKGYRLVVPVAASGERG